MYLKFKKGKLNRHFDEIIFRQLQTSLNQTWNDKLILEIKTELELLNTQKKCNQLSEDLDERNANLYKQLIRLGNNLFNFEFVSFLLKFQP